MKNKILIAGDDPGLFLAIKKMLKKEHCQLYTSSHPNEIFHLITKIHPRLLILNLKLYGNFGTELLVQIKKIFPYLQILVMTAFSNVLTEQFILQLGASGYLAMPFDIREMLYKIQQFLQIQNT